MTNLLQPRIFIFTLLSISYVQSFSDGTFHSSHISGPIPSRRSITIDDANAVHQKSDFWWMQKDSPFKFAYDAFRNCPPGEKCDENFHPGSMPAIGCNTNGCGIVNVQTSGSEIKQNPYLNGDVPLQLTQYQLGVPCYHPDNKNGGGSFHIVPGQPQVVPQGQATQISQQKADFSKNPFLAGQVPPTQNVALNHHVADSKADYSQNVFLTGKITPTQGVIPAGGNCNGAACTGSAQKPNFAGNPFLNGNVQSSQHHSSVPCNGAPGSPCSGSNQGVVHQQHHSSVPCNGAPGSPCSGSNQGVVHQQHQVSSVPCNGAPGSPCSGSSSSQQTKPNYSGNVFLTGQVQPSQQGGCNGSPGSSCGGNKSPDYTNNPYISGQVSSQSQFAPAPTTNVHTQQHTTTQVVSSKPNFNKNPFLSGQVPPSQFAPAPSQPTHTHTQQHVTSGHIIPSQPTHSTNVHTQQQHTTTTQITNKPNFSGNPFLNGQVPSSQFGPAPVPTQNVHTQQQTTTTQITNKPNFSGNPFLNSQVPSSQFGPAPVPSQPTHSTNVHTQQQTTTTQITNKPNFSGNPFLSGQVPSSQFGPAPVPSQPTQNVHTTTTHVTSKPDYSNNPYLSGQVPPSQFGPAPSQTNVHTQQHVTNKPNYSNNPFLTGQVPSVQPTHSTHIHTQHHTTNVHTQQQPTNAAPDYSNNPYLSGQVSTNQNAQIPASPQSPKKPDYSTNPFLNQQVSSQQPTKNNFPTTYPNQPQSLPTNVPSQHQSFPSSYPQKPTGFTLPQGVKCQGFGYICVPKAHCNNGLVVKNAEGLMQARDTVQTCNFNTESCCRLPQPNTENRKTTNVHQQTVFSQSTFAHVGTPTYPTKSGNEIPQESIGSPVIQPGSYVGNGIINVPPKYDGGLQQIIPQASALNPFQSTFDTDNKRGPQYIPPDSTPVKPTPEYVDLQPPYEGGSSILGPVIQTLPKRPPTTTTRRPTTQPNIYLPPIDQSGSEIFPTGISTTTPPPKQPDYDGGSSNTNPSFVQLPTTRPPPNPVPQYTNVDVNIAPHPGCAAALKCVPIEYCTAEAVISNTTVILTKEQNELRVPMTDCLDIETNIVGKCCRDPTYVDPWPVGQLGLWNPNNGFDDGSYRADKGGKYNGNENRPINTNQIISRPSTTNQLINRPTTTNQVVQRPYKPRPVENYEPLASGSGYCGVRNYNSTPKGQTPLDLTFGEIPWQAMVLQDTNRRLLCGGAIIRNDVVITAAHCVDGLLANDVLVKGGEWRLGIDEEPKPFQIAKVGAILKHPLYQRNNLVNDVALLILEENLKYDTHISPLCVEPVKEEVEIKYGNANCMTTGWGKEVLRINIGNSLPHSVPIELLPPRTCQASLQANYPDLQYRYEQKSCVCGAPRELERNLCDVDQGSALACDLGDGYYRLTGIYSWETGCEVPQGSQIASFTRLDLNWVNAQLRKPPKQVIQRYVQSGGEDCDCEE